MARFFDVTFLTPVISLDAERKGQASFTVTNATAASIRGDAVIVAQPGADAAWLKPERPSRHYPVGGSEQIGVAVEVPGDVAAGTYGFKLRMLLGGGVPEEQFDDSEVLQFTVEDAPPPPPPPPPPPKPKFPWWLIAIGVVLMLIVVGAIIWWVFIRVPPLTGDAVRIKTALPPPGQTLTSGQPTTVQLQIEYSLESIPQAGLWVTMEDFSGASNCTGTPTSGVAFNAASITQGKGEVTLPLGWTVAAGQGRVAPHVYYFVNFFQTVADFGAQQGYCYRYGP